MTELETMQRAKMYMDKLARGIDPITGHSLPTDTALNNARLARCFSYVSGVLGKVIENGGEVGQRVRTLDFAITPEQLARVRLSDEPLRIMEFTQALSEAVNNPDMKRLSAGKITQWLEEQGLMTRQTGPDGKTHGVPTQRGMQMGMSTRTHQSRDGEYQAVYYDRNMQCFLLDNLPAIQSASRKSQR